MIVLRVVLTHLLLLLEIKVSIRVARSMSQVLWMREGETHCSKLFTQNLTRHFLYLIGNPLASETPNSRGRKDLRYALDEM